MSQATTQRSRCRYTVKEYESGQPYITCELLDQLDLGVTGQWSWSFDLPPATTISEAQEIAHWMREHLVNVVYTRL